MDSGTGVGVSPYSVQDLVSEMDDKLDDLAQDQGMNERVKQKHIYNISQQLYKGKVRPFIDESFKELNED